MDETHWAADFLFRYMMARYHCKEGVLSPGSVRQLADEIRQGRPVFDGILIGTNASPRIINDFKAADFFVAIINGDDGAMPDTDPAKLAAWRKYVWEDARLPLPEPRDRQLVSTQQGRTAD
jgi:hypothetical protein